MTYSSNYFYALTIDEQDQYDAKKYYYNEMKDTLSTTPTHLFDPDSLYRAETAYSGNLVVMQRFYQLPFALDLHFGYRNETFTKAEMNYDQTTEALEAAEKGFQDAFDTIFVQGETRAPCDTPPCPTEAETGAVGEKLRSFSRKLSETNTTWT